MVRRTTIFGAVMRQHSGAGAHDRGQSSQLPVARKQRKDRKDRIFMSLQEYTPMF